MTLGLPDEFGFGQDLFCNPDVTSDMVECAGLVSFAQDLLHRLMTPRGNLIDDPNYGTDLRELVGASTDARTIAGIPGAIAAEFAKDDRVQKTDVKILALRGEDINLQFFVVSSAGPFKFTATIDKAQALLGEVG